MHVVLDTNVWVSALNFGGPPAQLLSLVLDGSLSISISAALEAELRRVLKERFGWTRGDLAETLEPILHLARRVRPRTPIQAAIDPDDNRVIECAVAAGAAIIITGDDHLLRLESYNEIQFLSPRDFLNLVSD